MIKRMVYVCLTLCFLALSACSKMPDNTSGLYNMAFDHIYDNNLPVNDNIQYIAVDFNSMSGLSPSEQTAITLHIESISGSKVKNKNFSELKAEGEISGDLDILGDGFLLYIERYYTVSETEISFQMVKYRSKKLAISVKYTFKKEKETWNLREKSTEWVY